MNYISRIVILMIIGLPQCLFAMEKTPKDNSTEQKTTLPTTINSSSCRLLISKKPSYQNIIELALNCENIKNAGQLKNDSLLSTDSLHESNYQRKESQASDDSDNYATHENGTKEKLSRWNIST